MRSDYSVNTIPRVSRPRTKFKYNLGNLTSFNLGDLVPFYTQMVYPGDTFVLDTQCLTRTSSPFIKSPMVNLHQDIMYFFVPLRLCWEHFEEFLGANKRGSWANDYVSSESMYTPSISYEALPFDQPSGNKLVPPVFFKTVLHYLGAKPPSTSDDPMSERIKQFNAMLPRAFALIWNEWFRNENVVDPVFVGNGSLLATGENFMQLYSADPHAESMQWGPNCYVCRLPKVSRGKDYFSCCLPAPQKGESPSISFTVKNDVPVLPKAGEYFIEPGSTIPDTPLVWAQNGGTALADGANVNLSVVLNEGKYPTFEAYGVPKYRSGKTSDLTTPLASNEDYSYIPINLWAKTENALLNGSINVNDLRLLVQTQMLLEMQARGGTRYQEILANEWGVTGSDSRLQIPEFLGGKSMPLNVVQVPQTSSTAQGSPQANISSFSQSLVNGRCVKSFNEHGFIIGVTCIRMKHIYQQGVERFCRGHLTRYDFYNPVFAGLGEQPVWASEIDNRAPSYQIFGYMPYAEDLRIRYSQITGQINTISGNESLAPWQAGDLYSNTPILSAEFIEEDEKFLDKCLTIKSTQQDQFICDFSTSVTSIREVTISGVPGKLDHIYAGGKF